MGLHKSKENRAPTTAKMWLLPAVFVLLAVVIMAFGEAGKEALRYDRVWIGQGETWRLLSGHFAHLSWSHLLLNSVGLLLVWFLIGANYSRWMWISVIAITLAVMDLAFWFLSSDLYWYVGMSGMLHGILLAGVMARLPQLDAEVVILLALLAAKIAWEQFAGPVPGSEATSGGPVVVDAHLYGAAGGLIGALFARIRVGGQASI